MAVQKKMTKKTTKKEIEELGVVPQPLEQALLATLGRMRKDASTVVTLCDRLEARIRREVPEEGLPSASEVTKLLLEHGSHLQADSLTLLGMVRSSDTIEGLDVDLLPEEPDRFGPLVDSDDEDIIGPETADPPGAPE